MSSIALDLSLFQECKNYSPSPKFHEYVAYDPKQQATSNRRWQIVWNLATRVGIIAYALIGVGLIALTAGSTILTSLTSIALFPFGFGVFYLLVSENWIEKAETYAKNAAFANAVLKKEKTIPDDTIANRIEGYGLDPSQISHEVKLFKPLLARLELLADKENAVREQVKEKETEVQLLSQASLDLTKPEDITAFYALHKNRWKNEDAEKRAALYRLEQAFLLKVLQDPGNQNVRSSQFFEKNRCHTALLLMAKNEKNAPKEFFIQTKEEESKTYTQKEILEKSLLELAKEIFHLKT